MKCQAAVLRGVGQDWEVCEIELDKPRRGEVLVRMATAGICHTDDHFATGDAVPSPELVELMRAAGMATPDWFPLIGGHEGAGVVEEVARRSTASNQAITWECPSSPPAANAGGVSVGKATSAM